MIIDFKDSLANVSIALLEATHTGTKRSNNPGTSAK
jgi:hypothetical protein